ncbi:MAG: gluconate 2-dehydrogenase subunit 3 family protein [Acidimicrobiales bacterium]
MPRSPGTRWQVKVATGRNITRRTFLQAATAAAGAAALPLAPGISQLFRAAQLAGSSAAAPKNTLGGPFFLTGGDAYATCAALCACVLPTGTNPVTGAITSPGATEANAVQFIDMFLAAFELPSTIADNPAVYLQGRYSGRNPFPPVDPDAPGAFTAGNLRYPADQLELAGGQRQFLGLSAQQLISWYLQLYGTLTDIEEVLSAAPWAAKAQFPFVNSGLWSAKWLSQVESGQIPGVVPGGLRALYVNGLAAFDSWAEQNFQTTFASCATAEQQAMALVAANPLLNAAASNGLSLPAPLPSPTPPAPAAKLFGTLALHTIQGSYCLPEYGGNGGTLSPSAAPVMWTSLKWDGDTEPLGNTVYDASAYGPGAGPNAGFGEAGVYQPRGTMVEFRPTSYPGNDPSLATVEELQALLQYLAKAGGQVTVP